MTAALLWPAIVQAALIGAVYVSLSFVRGKAVVGGDVPDTDFAPWDEPRESAAVRRHLANQFEMPLLFFVVVGYLVATGAANAFDVWCAWGFVASRVVHSIGALRGPLWLRHAAFSLGALLVAGLWLHLAATLL
jgi:hypothetical protein